MPRETGHHRDAAVNRVALQLVSTGGFYGAERTLLELATYLSEQRWESHIVALEGRGVPELMRRAMQCRIAATAFSDGRRLGAGAILWKLGRLLARYPRAIVHSHGYKPDVLLAALRAPRRFGCLATCHSWYSDTLRMRFVERLDKRLLRGFDHVIAVSDEIQGELLASGLAPGRISIIDNGISVPARDPDARSSVRQEFGLRPDERVIVQIGRIARSKRNDLLLEAVARLVAEMPAKILFVGEGPERQALQERARDLGIASQVVFCGYRDDVHRLICAADVFALTSNKEGLPIVVLEAMALGCPIVSTAVGAVPSALDSGANGSLVPIDDLDALTRALAESLSAPSVAREKAGRARRTFLERFSRDTMGKRYLRLYEQTWKERGWD